MELSQPALDSKVIAERSCVGIPQKPLMQMLASKRLASIILLLSAMQNANSFYLVLSRLPPRSASRLNLGAPLTQELVRISSEATRIVANLPPQMGHVSLHVRMTMEAAFLGFVTKLQASITQTHSVKHTTQRVLRMARVV